MVTPPQSVNRHIILRFVTFSHQLKTVISFEDVRGINPPRSFPLWKSKVEETHSDLDADHGKNLERFRVTKTRITILVRFFSVNILSGYKIHLLFFTNEQWPFGEASSPSQSLHKLGLKFENRYRQRVLVKSFDKLYQFYQ